MTAVATFFNPVMTQIYAAAAYVQSMLSGTTSTTSTDLLDAVGEAIGTILDWVGTVITALLTAGGALNPLLGLFAVGIAISAIMLGVKVIKGFIWGS